MSGPEVHTHSHVLRVGAAVVPKLYLGLLILDGPADLSKDLSDGIASELEPLIVLRHLSNRTEAATG